MPDDEKKEGQQEGDKDGKTKEEGDSQPGSLRLKVGGEDVVLTPSEIEARLARAEEKEKGADEKFRQAADQRKYFESLGADLQAAQKGDKEALRRMAQYKELGIPKDAVEQAIKQMAEKGEGDGEEYAPIGYDDLDPELADDLKRSKAEYYAGLVSKMHETLDTHLDKDEVMGAIMKDERYGRLVTRARAHAREALRRRAADAVQQGEKKWTPRPQDFQRITQDTRAWLEDVLSTGEEQQEAAAGQSETGSLPAIGRSPTGRLASLQPKEPPKRVSSKNAGEYAENMMDRLNAEMGH